MSTPAPSDDGKPPALALRIDAACDRFEGAWRAGPPPRVEDFLEGWHGPDRAALLREFASWHRWPSSTPTAAASSTATNRRPPS